jgi:hypothetical protein
VAVDNLFAKSGFPPPRVAQRVFALVDFDLIEFSLLEVLMATEVQPFVVRDSQTQTWKGLGRDGA